MFFSKEVVQNEAKVLYDDKEILDALNDYYNNTILEDQTKEDKEKVYKLFNSYCNKFYKKSFISNLEEEFYNKFLLLFMPSYSLTFTEKELKNILNELTKFLEYINNNYGGNLYRAYRKDFSSNVDEMLRVYYILRKIQKYTESCVLSFNPMVIDINCYKKRKSSKEVSKREIFEQGHFEIIDKIGGIIILKKFKLNSTNTYIKIKVENSLASDMKCKDIINMRIKRKFFYTTWDIIDVKDYYSYKISKYID